MVNAIFTLKNKEKYRIMPLLKMEHRSSVGLVYFSKRRPIRASDCATFPKGDQSERRIVPPFQKETNSSVGLVHFSKRRPI